jgi:hypothetical protein
MGTVINYALVKRIFEWDAVFGRGTSIYDMPWL